jgi:hypothetical protein
VSDEGFEDIVVDRSSGRVVGIRVLTSAGDAGRGVVLVDERGELRRDDDDDDAAAVVTVSMTNVSSTASAVRGLSSSPSRSSGERRGSGDGGGASAAANPRLDANGELLLQYGPMALGALLILRIVLSALGNALPLLVMTAAAYLYVSASCPPNDTFDAKRELKRAMRGEHLPEELRPRGLLERGLNRLAASVTTELATSLGYDISMTDCIGAATMACVTVPCNGMEYYWIGILGE